MIQLCAYEARKESVLFKFDTGLCGLKPVTELAKSTSKSEKKINDPTWNDRKPKETCFPTYPGLPG